jgi:hypothetical protein
VKAEPAESAKRRRVGASISIDLTDDDSARPVPLDAYAPRLPRGAISVEDDSASQYDTLFGSMPSHVVDVFAYSGVVAVNESVHFIREHDALFPGGVIRVNNVAGTQIGRLDDRDAPLVCAMLDSNKVQSGLHFAGW